MYFEKSRSNRAIEKMRGTNNLMMNLKGEKKDKIKEFMYKKSNQQIVFGELPLHLEKSFG